MATKLYPTVQFKPGTYELDEFDCASIFLLVGTEKAMLIDTGIGIGDLLGAVRQLTDKPLVVVMSHGHGDHTGGCGQFEEIYLNEKDWSFAELENMEMRKGYAALIARRQGGLYAYDPEKDILPWEKAPRRLPLKDGQKFDLGGGRVVTAYDCPGHTAGEMVFLDESTHTLFAGDAVNCNLGLRGVPGDPNFVSVEKALGYLERLYDMRDRYDGIYNGHHDFRPLGCPLAEDVLPNAIDLCRQLVDGSYQPVTVPAAFPGQPDRVVVKKGEVMISYSEEGIHEPKA